MLTAYVMLSCLGILQSLVSQLANFIMLVNPQRVKLKVALLRAVTSSANQLSQVEFTYMLSQRITMVMSKNKTLVLILLITARITRNMHQPVKT